jgi:hypothetical protein
MQGRPASYGKSRKRWSYDLRKTTGKSWMRVAEDRAKWREVEDAYIQQWTVAGILNTDDKIIAHFNGLVAYLDMNLN